MKVISKVLFNCSMLLMMGAAAHAAGTYPTGAYQSPQKRYSQQGVSAYNRNQYANAGYSTKQNNRVNQNQPVMASGTQDGFTFEAGLSKQTSMWQFEMKNAGSKLHYDNVDWLVFNAGGKYVFGGNTKFQVDAGLQYGMQTGETSMVDDDISHGGYFYDEYVMENVDGGYTTVGSSIGHALSVGTSKGGSMLGFHAGFGLTDFMKIGKLKITPSVGWRYLKYTLETTNNKGTVFVNGDFDGSCMTLADGSTQCLPLVGVYVPADDGSGNVVGDPYYPGYVYFDAYGNKLDIENGSFVYPGTSTPAEPVFALVPSLGYSDVVGNFYFEQPDVSHSYEVAWSGPYVALDMRYDINPTNVVTANVELGLPSYSAVADQPYRFDWQHPKSIEDKSGLGGALHFGLGANWSTALSDSIALTVGVTYDYYSVSGADATTYFNPDYYMGMYNSWVDDIVQKTGVGQLEAENILLNGSEEYAYAPSEDAIMIRELKDNGWKNTADGEIESFYKSLGIRVGLRAKF